MYIAGTMMYWNLYPAFFCLVLLLVPLGYFQFLQTLRTFILDKFLGIKIPGLSIVYLHFVILMSLSVFGWTHYELGRIQSRLSSMPYVDPLFANEINKITGHADPSPQLYARRLKLERNWWIALFASTLWITVFVLNQRTKQLEELQRDRQRKAE